MLRAWLGVHPAKDEPAAPLFPTFRDKSGRGRLDRAVVATVFRQGCRKAGLRRIHPHLLRHTRVTEAARAGWNEAQLRAYFGWGRTSRMPSHYTHLAYADMRQRVLDEAGLTEAGAPFRGYPKPEPEPTSTPANAPSLGLGEALAAIANSQLVLTELLRRSLPLD